MHASSNGHVEVVRTLLEAGATIDLATGLRGMSLSDTALTVAVRTRQVEIFRILLEEGADPTAGGGVLDSLVKGGQEDTEDLDEMLRVLLEAGFDPDHRFIWVESVAGKQPIVVEDTTMLILAAHSEREGAIELLLEAGADPSLKDSKGRTALDVAQSDVVRQLLRGDAAIEG